MWFDFSAYWYASKLKLKFNIFIYLLLPFSYFFKFIIFIRKYLYKIGVFKTHHFPVPIIIVGNITVGGTGKTPFVIWLAKLLKSHGYQPGIVSRGAGGKKHIKPYLVSSSDSSKEVGDEALLLTSHTDCPVMIAINRPSAVKKLLQENNCNIVISDDGLQHYALNRDMEIVIVDGERQFGNGYLLPAGPLREPLSRLNEVDFVVENGSMMSFIYGDLISLSEPTQTTQLINFLNSRVHAVAGIGNPERFFSVLKKAGLDIIPHIFPDHHHYQSQDFNFASNNNFPIIMTEKDAVKCKLFANNKFWYLPVTAQLSEKFSENLLEKLN
jgi:tetraacyldisaccharide 4'-kinase